MKANRPHFHVWRKAATGRAYFRLARGFHTSQAARQWAKRNRPDAEHMVIACYDAACAPPL